jgi:hypothetical protein
MRLTRRRAERLAPLLLMFGCWGFQSPSLRQGAVGTGYFEPSGVFFGIALVQNKSPPIRSAFHFGSVRGRSRSAARSRVLGSKPARKRMGLESASRSLLRRKNTVCVIDNTRPALNSRAV